MAKSRKREDKPKRRSPQDIFAGSRLRDARRMRGYSQEQVGDVLGVSFQAIQKYESGENRISAGRLMKAAEFLEVPLAYFAPDKAGEQPTGVTLEFSDEELRLIRAYRALGSDSVRAQVRRLVEAMGEQRPRARSSG